jgi:DNA-binding transcriptional LysR family regulator
MPGEKMIELTDLRVFMAAAEERSFSKAATRLHLSQSAISQTIQSMERAFGVELFVRHGRSVWLSEAGQALLPLAKEVLSSSRLLEEAMNNIQAQVSGELVIGCSTTSGKYLLPNLVASFRHEYPSVHVRIVIMNRDEVVARILDERFPMGVVSKRIESHEVEHQPLFEDRVILIVPPDHPWGQYGKALPADLIDQPLILREDNAGTTEVMLEGLAQHGINLDNLNVVLEIGNSEAIEMAVEEGNGIAFVSELAAARGLALGRVKKVNVDGMELRRTIYIARNTRHPLSRAQDRFWNFALEQRENISKITWDKIAGLNDSFRGDFRSLGSFRLFR